MAAAVQVCVDLAAHLGTAAVAPAPTTMAETFERLCEAGLLDPGLADRMKRALGFRNLAIHQYQALSWAVVPAICTRHLGDFRDFARVVAERLLPP